MSAFILADINVNDPETYKEYVAQVPALVAKHGGNYRARGSASTTLEGKWEPNRLVLLEFPSRQSAEAFYNDPDYQSIKQIRLNTSESNLVLFEGI